MELLNNISETLIFYITTEIKPIPVHKASTFVEFGRSNLSVAFKKVVLD